MKNFIIFTAFLISSNAFCEDFDFNGFAKELEALESNQVLSAPKVFVDEISNTQSALLGPDSVEMDEIYKIIPLPGFEAPDSIDAQESQKSATPKRIRSK